MYVGTVHLSNSFQCMGSFPHFILLLPPWIKSNFMISIYESPHDKTNKVSVRPAKTQIRLGPPSLISLRCALTG